MALPVARPTEPESGALPVRDLTTPRRRLMADRMARWGVTLGGLCIIAGVLGILLFILVPWLALQLR